jgi:transcriptional regulator with XRE-family HTH domain
MELSERIRLVREAAGFTQADIASKLGISSQAYGKIERQAERPTIENIRNIAVTLDVNVSKPKDQVVKLRFLVVSLLLCCVLHGLLIPVISG